MNHNLWVATRTVLPPKIITQELRQAREKWYRQNPWRPDWDAEAVQQKAAYLCIQSSR